MCPKCKSKDLWDDNFWWGCNRCGFMQNLEDFQGISLIEAPREHPPAHVEDWDDD